MSGSGILSRAIYDLHGCDSTWTESVPVTQTFEGRTIWDGVVHVFTLYGHPTATRCYAWSHTSDDSGQRRSLAVLHRGPVNSPQAAVNWAILQERLNNGSEA